MDGGRARIPRRVAVCRGAWRRTSYPADHSQSRIAGDVARACALISRLLDRRPADKNSIGHFTAKLARGRILLAQPDFDEAREELNLALEYFHQHGLYYYEAQACLGLAICEFKSSREPQMLEHLRRVLDLAARYDYEYWLRQEVAAHPEIFNSEDAQELLPADLRGQMAAVPRLTTATIVTSATILSARSLVDLTINMLGPVEIFRDMARPFAADAWTT